MFVGGEDSSGEECMGCVCKVLGLNPHTEKEKSSVVCFMCILIFYYHSDYGLRLYSSGNRELACMYKALGWIPGIIHTEYGDINLYVIPELGR